MMYTDQGLRDFEALSAEFAQTYRRLGTVIDRDPEAIRNYLHLDEIRYMAYLMVPETYNDKPLKVKCGDYFYGMTCLERVIALEYFAYGDAGVMLACPGPSLSGVVINDLASEKQKEYYFSQIMREPTWTFFALSEPRKGTDATQMETRLERLENGTFLLQGEKYFVGNGTRGQFGVVFARLAEGPLGVEIVLVEKGQEGFTAQPLDTLGLKGAKISHLHFDGCIIEPNMHIGHHLRPTQRGLWGAIHTFHKMRPGVSALALGVARAAFDYAKKEKRYFTPSETLELERIEYRIQATRLVLRKAAASLDQGQKNAAYLASIGKIQAVQLVEEVTDYVVNLLQPATLYEHPLLNKWYRDARAFEYMEGTTNIQTLHVFQAYQNGKMSNV